MTDSIGYKILDLINKSGYESLGQLSKDSGVSTATLSRITNNIQKPTPSTLKKLAPYLKIPYETLMKIAGYLPSDKELADISSTHRRIEAALADDPDAEELLAFWKEMKEREDLKLLFKQVRPLSDDTIRKVVRIIKVIEDEEQEELNR